MALDQLQILHVDLGVDYFLLFLTWNVWFLVGSFVTGQSLVRCFSVSGQRNGFSKYHCDKTHQFSIGELEGNVVTKHNTNLICIKLQSFVWLKNNLEKRHYKFDFLRASPDVHPTATLQRRQRRRTRISPMHNQQIKTVNQKGEHLWVFMESP